MKYQVRVSFHVQDVTQPVRDQILQWKLPVGWPSEEVGAELAPPSAEVWLEGHDERLASLRVLLTSQGVMWRERHETQYDEAELDAADLLALYITSAPLALYEFEQLDRAPFADEPETPVTLRRQKLPRRGDIRTSIYDDVLISERLRDQFLTHAITGVRYRPVTSPEGTATRWWLMATLDRLPPMSAATTGIVRDITVAPDGSEVPADYGYAHTFQEPTRITYDRLEMDTFPDIMATWERFGAGSHAGRHPRGRLIVRNRVRRLLVDLKIRQVRFEPVEIRSR